MSFKKMIFVLTITVSAIFLLMFGTSYAYYVSDADVDLNITTGNFDADVAVVFNQNQYVNLNTGIPISEDEVLTKAGRSVFTLVPDANILEGYEVFASISLTDISIDEELKVSDFKYALNCYMVNQQTEAGSGPTRNTGNGLDFTETVLDSGDLVLTTININPLFYYECSLYVYLQETDENQNHLMNKNFSARIKVNSSFRK